jgi:hypothetical protein
MRYLEETKEWWNNLTATAQTNIFNEYKEVLSVQKPQELQYEDLVSIYIIECILSGKPEQTVSQNTYKVFDCVPYQCCPVCNGTGQVVADGYTSAVYQPCKVCNGARIIPMHVTEPAPVKYGILGSLCNHNFEHKDSHWKSCVNCGMLEPINK